VKALALMIRPTHRGWAVQLTDGRELARFNGPVARWRALRYIAHMTGSEARPQATCFSSSRRDGRDQDHAR
jgi:hypothetical protein